MLAVRQEAIRALVARTGRAMDGEAGDICRLMWPADPPTLPHQDAAYVGDQETWTVWVPLMALGPGHGGLRVVADGAPGGLLDHPGGGSAGCVVPSKAVWMGGPLGLGQAVAFSGRVVHRADPGSQGLRVSVDLRFVAAG